MYFHKMYFRIKTPLLLFISSLIFLSSCFKDLDQISWDAQIVTPIAKTSLTISDLIDDTTNIRADENKQLKLVYRQKIYSYDNPLSDLINIQIRPLIKDVTLQSLELSPQSFGSTITLGEIIGDNTFLQMVFPDDSTVKNDYKGFTFSPKVDPFLVDISNFLESAVLTHGTLGIQLFNNLPLNFSSLDLELSNTANKTVIYTKKYSINSGQTINDQIDLAQALNGKPIEGNLTVEIKNIQAQTPPNKDSLDIDYSDSFGAIMQLSGLKVSEATAIFPAQNLVDARDTVGLLGMGDVELTKAKIKQGRVSAKVTSTVESDMEMEYYIPSATLNGNVFNFLADVPAAPPGGSYQFLEEFPYDNYIFDFTGKDGTLTNTFYNELYARIDSTGELIHLSLEDTLSMEIRVEEMTPSYVEGYFGQETLTIDPDTILIDFFSAFKAGSADFESAKMNITIENGLGIDGQLKFDQLTALNTYNGTSYNLPGLTPFSIQEATNLGINNGFVPNVQTLSIPNPERLLNILPNKLFYKISGQLNPNGNTPAYNDFLFEGASLTAFLDVEVPLSFKANGIKLIDTVQYNDETIAAPEEITSGTLRFIVQNTFPFNAQLKAYFLSPNNTIIDSLIALEPIKSGTIINNNSPATSVETVLEFPISNTSLKHVLASNNLILEVVFNSPNMQYSKIYASNSLDIQITADFKYAAKTGF